MQGRVSSQFVSALLLVAPLAAQDVEVELEETRPTSLPFVLMTLAAMRTFGAHVQQLALNRFWVRAGGYRSPTEVQVEGDATSATYALAAAAVTGGRVRVEGVGSGSVQGDAAFAQLLQRMGCEVRQGEGFTEVAGPGAGGLTGVEADMGDMTDAFMTAAVVAAMAKGVSRFTGIANQVRASVRACPRMRAWR